MTDKHPVVQTWGEFVAARKARSEAASRGAATRKANDPRNAPCTSTFTSKQSGKVYHCQRHISGYHISEEHGGRIEWRIE